MKKIALSTVFGLLVSTAACQPAPEKGTFGYDLEFLQKHKEVVVLKSDSDSCQVAIIPDYQGRVMTSTSNGAEGKSYGWINHDLISSGEFVEHINVFGGEDRFWMGPEGGQYSIFFENGKDFTFENWFTPAAIDTEPFETVEHDDSSASFRRKVTLSNYSGYSFDIEVMRKISILTKAEIESNLNIELGADVKYVGFQSVNNLKNTGSTAWQKETGLLSVWILGMFNPSDETSIIIPYKNALQLKSDYFGEVPADRLVTTNKAIFFKGDGRHRSKIGLPPANIVPVCGSYDAENNLLTIVEYTFSGEKDYVNSFWELQDQPFAGDVVNSYNDGPLEDGSQLGPFYELESSSSARALKPNETIEHTHKTYHFEGSFDELNGISQKLLGVDLNSIAFNDEQPARGKNAGQANVLVPYQENNYVPIYQPAGDYFFGPDTEQLKEGKWYDRWIPNDHCFVKAEDGKWHIFGITHPYTDPKLGGIHQGEYASFHALSSVTNFKDSVKAEHYSDLPKILTPKERPDEIPQNHAPYVVKKDGLYHMVYGHSPIRLATSSDLHKWTPRGELFDEEKGGRDPNLILHDGTYYITYCSEKCVRMRTSKDLIHWSEAKTILQTNEFDPESPSIIFHNDTFYLFVCAWIKGSWDRIDLLGAYTHKAHVYASDDLMDFGTDDEKQITILDSHAPEILQGEDGQWYISSVVYPDMGVSIDKLSWK